MPIHTLPSFISRVYACNYEQNDSIIVFIDEFPLLEFGIVEKLNVNHISYHTTCFAVIGPKVSCRYIVLLGKNLQIK